MSGISGRTLSEGSARFAYRLRSLKRAMGGGGRQVERLSGAKLCVEAVAGARELRHWLIGVSLLVARWGAKRRNHPFLGSVAGGLDTGQRER